MSAGYLTRVVVLAKAPEAGRSKTRLTPPYTPDQAAAIAQACLQDTLETVGSLAAADEGFDAVLCLDGDPGPWLPAEMPVIRQCIGGHDIRIAQAIEQAVQLAGRREADSVLLVGMDTPQVTSDLLRGAAHVTRSLDAVLAPAEDGGWWLLGLRRRHARRARDLVVGVPTSTRHTAAFQRQRLRDRGLSIGTLQALRDIDTAADIEAVLLDMTRTARPTRFVSVAQSLREEAAA